MTPRGGDRSFISGFAALVVIDQARRVLVLYPSVHI